MIGVRFSKKAAARKSPFDTTMKIQIGQMKIQSAILLVATVLPLASGCDRQGVGHPAGGTESANPADANRVQVLTGTLQVVLVETPASASGRYSQSVYFRAGGKRYRLVYSKDAKFVGDDVGVVNAGGNYRVTGAIESDRILVRMREYLGPQSPALAKLWTRPLDMQSAREALAAGVDVNADDGSGHTILHRVFYQNAASDKLEVARLLIAAGANVNARDDDGCTPLHFATSIPEIELLLKSGADINAESTIGETPLDYRAKEDRVNVREAGRVIDYLIKNGAAFGKNPVAHYDLAWIFVKAGRREDAARVFREFLELEKAEKQPNEELIERAKKILSQIDKQ